MYIPYKKLNPDVEVPKAAHMNDAGNDYAFPEDVTIHHGRNVIPMGIRAKLPPTTFAVLAPRSSFMDRLSAGGLVPIDADYSGEWHMSFYNMEDEFVVKKGERIGQVLVLDCHQQVWIPEEEYEAGRRKDGGFGSTGR